MVIDNLLVERARKSLVKRFPCRKPQIDSLLSYLGTHAEVREPIFVYGEESSGKTAVVKETLKELGCVHVYINCVETHSTKEIYAAILRQLQKTDEKSIAAGDVRGESVSKFVMELNQVLKESGHHRVCVVVDKVERIDSLDVLVSLSRLNEIGDLNMSIIMISTLPWTTGRFMRESKQVMSPGMVEFPAYTSDDMVQVLLHLHNERQDIHKQYYIQFVKFVVPLVYRATNNLLDISRILQKLWPVYITPVQEGEKIQAPKLNTRIMPNLKMVVSDLDIGEANTSIMDQTQSNASRMSGEEARLLLEIPYMSKFVLLAAYIASRNAPTSDRSIFDPGYSKRQRKNAQALDRQAERARSAKFKGAHTFHFERLLHIFYYICEQHAPDMEGLEQWRVQMQQVDVMMQISSLVSLGLLSLHSSSILDGASYGCNISDEIAYEIAQNLKVQLNNYLKLA